MLFVLFILDEDDELFPIDKLALCETFVVSH